MQRFQSWKCKMIYLASFLRQIFCIWCVCVNYNIFILFFTLEIISKINFIFNDSLVRSCSEFLISRFVILKLFNFFYFSHSRTIFKNVSDIKAGFLLVIDPGNQKLSCISVEFVILHMKRTFIWSYVWFVSLVFCNFQILFDRVVKMILVYLWLQVIWVRRRRLVFFINFRLWNLLFLRMWFNFFNHAKFYFHLFWSLDWLFLLAGFMMSKKTQGPFALHTDFLF